MRMRKIHVRFLAFCLLCFSASAVSLAQPSSSSPQMDAANELFKAQNWAEAEKAYNDVVKKEPQNGGAWYQLAMSRFSLRQYSQAVTPFEKAIELSGSGVAMYNLACAYARLNQKDKAFEWLGKAIGSRQAARFANFTADPDLENLRDDARFKEAAQALERRTKPCMYSEQNRQLDFWVGEWDVFNPQGQKVGTSVIERVSVGCAILENWSAGVGGGSGKSLNFYDPRVSKWFQHWMGGDGTPQQYSGVFKDNAMRYESEGVMPDGKKIMRRLTFFNLDAGTVRQLAEDSPDEGKTWRVLYDFKYVRRK